MTLQTLAPVFTLQQPLGPIAVSDDDDPRALQQIYDTRCELHLRSAVNPPTFIVGRRGSGKTSLLLSRGFDPANLTVRLSADRIYSLVQAMLARFETQVSMPVEAVADLWELLLWVPIAAALARSPDRRDPPAQAQILWEETAPLRTLPDRRDEADVGIETAALMLIDHLDGLDRVLSAARVLDGFVLAERPWRVVVRAATEVLQARALPAFVLIDSLENIGPHIDRLQATLQGLCHLVGRLGSPSRARPITVQCCFPSELWSRLDDISSNPVKDLAGRLVLQWRWQDLLRATGMRLRSFLEVHYPTIDALDSDDPVTLLGRLFPPSVVNRSGIEEPTYAYLLRHTQLLPRQIFHIINSALAQALIETGTPRVAGHHLVAAVAEVEAALCPEVFSAHSYRYPLAHQVARQLIPFLPFRFDDAELHRMCNLAGISKHFRLDYREVREMFATIGIIGRCVHETQAYVTAEFAYSVEGQLVLSPDECYALHPLFVRQYRSADLVRRRAGGGPAPKPVYPVGVPVA